MSDESEAAQAAPTNEGSSTGETVAENTPDTDAA